MLVTSTSAVPVYAKSSSANSASSSVAHSSSYGEIAANLSKDASLATEAVKMFLSESPSSEQIQGAIASAGFSETDLVALRDAINKIAGASTGSPPRQAEDNSRNTSSTATSGVITSASQGGSTSSKASTPSSTASMNAAQRLIFNNAQAAKPTDTLSTCFGWGPRISIQQARDFFATNPSDDAVLQKAADLKMSTSELSSALAYGRGDLFDEQSTSELVNKSSKFGFDSEGHIVALNGRSKAAQNGNSMLTLSA